MRFRISQEDKELVENEARKLGLKPSSFIHLLIKQYFADIHFFHSFLEPRKKGATEKALVYKWDN